MKHPNPLPVQLPADRRRPGPPPKQPRWKSLFLAELAELGNVSDAIAASGVARSTVYAHRKTDPAFAAEWNSALDEVIAHLYAGSAFDPSRKAMAC